MVKPLNLPVHIGFIMDGNGRWAKSKGLLKSLGHVMGANNTINIIDRCRHYNIKYITFYVLSYDNLRRNEQEVCNIVQIINIYLNSHAVLQFFNTRGISVSFTGDMSALPEDIVNNLKQVERLTANNTNMNIIFAIAYSSRREILNTVNSILSDGHKSVDSEEFASYLNPNKIPDPDLIIRTGREKRLSDFLIWQIIYSEIIFLDCLWPEFDACHFDEAIEDYCSRSRNYGL